MKAADIVALVIFALIVWPWGVGVADIAAYGATGAQLTSIPWNSVRGFILVVWPLGAGILAVFFTAMFCQ